MLERNIPVRVAKSQAKISKIVKLVTTGSGIRIISVIITPREIPIAKLENKMLRLWMARIVITVLGFTPIARKTANS